MKYPKILSLTLANGIGFLIFGTVLAGCQRTAVPKQGFFSKFSAKENSSLGRMPASSASSFGNRAKSVLAFEKFQDAKQIYIYCSLNDLNPQTCFKRQLDESLKIFSRKRSLSKAQEQSIKEHLSYANVKEETESALSKIFMAINPSINKLVDKRVSFCQKNSELYFNRCLKQYVNKETFEVLNAYQHHNLSINGHEYLFLKNRIEKKIIYKLDHAHNTQKSEEERASSRI